jgi:hypothetical protein
MEEPLSKRVFKDGCRVAITEFEVRTINGDGDVEDVTHFETKQEALSFAQNVAEADAINAAPGVSARAVVVEKHVSRYPAHLFAEPSRYSTVAVFGAKAALLEGGWIAKEEV